jgi:hypothetical protein
MKKSFFIFLLFLLCGCKKKSEQPTIPATIIEYNFTATASTSYKVYYNDANGQTVTATFIGASWDKKISTDSIIYKPSNGVPVAVFGLINTAMVNPEITGTISILVNDKLVNSENIKVLSANGGYEISGDVFK